MGRIVFITGTDTGAGKTVLTALLTAHLRAKNVDVMAIKPISSGNREDAKLLRAIQKGPTNLDLINPWHYRAPLAPALAAQLEKKPIDFGKLSGEIRRLSRACEVLLVEGIGGVMVPITRAKLVLDLIIHLKAETILAGRNRLGIINHALMGFDVLQRSGFKPFAIVLMGVEKSDKSVKRNASMIQEWTGCPVSEIPFLGEKARKNEGLEQSAKKFEKTLARIWVGD